MDGISVVSVIIDDEIKNNKFNETDENNINDTKDTDEPHNGNPITKINLSSNEKYFVTYSKVDSSIICWNVENVKFSATYMCVSDDKKLVYVEMDNGISELILSSGGKILIYSMQNKDNLWKCKRICKKLIDANLLSISIYDKLYLYLNNSIYEWNLINEKSIKILDIDEEMKYIDRKLIRISSNENLACLRIKSKIIIYSFELEIPIASLDIKNDLICARNEKINLKDGIGIIGFKLFNDSDIIILTEIGLLIYHFNENKKSISLNYFYYMNLCNKEVLSNYYKDVFLKSNLPLPNYDSFKLCDGWVSNIKDNKEFLSKYGVELLLFAIKEHKLLKATIVLGLFHLNFEVRQIIYDPFKWLQDFWNLTDVIAVLLPIGTSIYWLQTDYRNIPILSFTCLFLDIKLIVFLRIFESFETDFSFKKYMNNNDPNNPWNLVSAYYRVFENGTIDYNPYMIQPPNGNTNMFANYKTALLATYLFLTGDSSALSNWSYVDNPSLAIMFVLFSLFISIYIMNLFIGLINNAIQKADNRVSYLIYKAEILAEIELFYLLPYQRRWNTWFLKYYYANVDIVREKVKEMIREGEWNTDEFSEMKQNLLKNLNIKYNPNNNIDYLNSEEKRI
ncbi:hypothetical protein GLOIN_2v1871629 [Rhizophagus irregularis DAOM 181602=DAOM 197198]|uniref:Ion transport domain-containing protein n=2 Tax=Rhizophagus irregularis TaxID=588596 RepID=A0A2P4QHR8_RHIID|nr:hypothetical protein GLOIN_2v1871629 [Rhizophagus irregularis DAOM 181602=DAOM 197198]POG77193.1 hypothetical protein GLOIN_2v1871629 [Rhizophagus irregularis DAOM 181602=DAOM 197198]|eukprot:XP_025184059.1 hypothetical protein GLOIN_2v1871629 [Rhizophagus irregularis DAOM 181602=DAOM 197198]